MHNVNNKSLLGQIWKCMGECVGEYAGNVKGREWEGKELLDMPCVDS